MIIRSANFSYTNLGDFTDLLALTTVPTALMKPLESHLDWTVTLLRINNL